MKWCLKMKYGYVKTDSSKVIGQSEKMYRYLKRKSSKNIQYWTEKFSHYEGNMITWHLQNMTKQQSADILKIAGTMWDYDY